MFFIREYEQNNNAHYKQLFSSKYFCIVEFKEFLFSIDFIVTQCLVKMTSKLSVFGVQVLYCCFGLNIMFFCIILFLHILLGSQEISSKVKQINSLSAHNSSSENDGQSHYFKLFRLIHSAFIFQLSIWCSCFELKHVFDFM